MFVKSRVAALCLSAVLSLPFLAAQAPATKPETPAPAPTKAAPPQTTESGHPMNAYWTAHDKQLLTDFG